MKYDTIEFLAKDKTIRMCDNGGVMARHYKKNMFYEPHMLEYIRSLESDGGVHRCWSQYRKSYRIL